MDALAGELGAPEGKRAVVDALAGAGQYVAMAGDGVNDVAALKQARLTLAHGSGAQMSRSVADLVLVRDDFAVVPAMVAEGRQILRNVQRVARLFVTKAVFTAVLGLAVGIPTATFPLLPRQFTIASTVTIGIPAFVLALAPSSAPWRPERYLNSVDRFAIPRSRQASAGGDVSPALGCARRWLCCSPSRSPSHCCAISMSCLRSAPTPSLPGRSVPRSGRRDALRTAPVARALTARLFRRGHGLRTCPVG